jgi:hypothetical protein
LLDVVDTVDMYVPAAQSVLTVQSAAPAEAAYPYDGHPTQCELEVTAPLPYLPASQAVQVVSPAVLAWYLPSGHAVQEVSPAVAWNVPAAQSVQAVPSALEAAALLRDFPAAQAMQEVSASVGWYSPEGHGWQCEEASLSISLLP